MKNIFSLLSLCLLITSCSYGQSFGDKASQKVVFSMAAIENLYVDTINKDKLAEDAIIALLAKLDPHSGYLNQEEVKDMNEPLQGNFDGIGVQFNMLTDTLYIVQVVPGGPSEKVGVMAGDRIIMVNDTLIAGVEMKNTDIMSRLRGPKGTVVNLKIKRGNNASLIPFRIVRDKIPIYSLDASYMIDKQTGYIKLNRFAETTYDEFKDALSKLQSKGMKNLILDLQDNGGGYLNTAINIANEFLKRGSLIVYTEGVHQQREDAHATSRGSFMDGKLIVLVNESSASASEIVSGALQDWDRAVIVGRRTFGKGLVQRPIPLPDKSMIKLTTARYYTPTGRSIQKPYENGDTESYNMEVIKRYNSGEMISADSIHFADSLKYNTLVNKRIVYGGGGIMPDYFVPIDTSRFTDIHRALIASGTLNKYIMSYIDRNRERLKGQYSDLAQFKSQFNVSESMLNELLDMFKKEDFEFHRNSKSVQLSEEEITDLQNNNFVMTEAMLKKLSNSIQNQAVSEKEEDKKPVVITTSDMTDFEKSKSLIKLQIKALIARDIWDMNEYFQIINDENESLKKAIEIINNSKEYDKLLGK